MIYGKIVNVTRQKITVQHLSVQLQLQGQHRKSSGRRPPRGCGYISLEGQMFILVIGANIRSHTYNLQSNHHTRWNNFFLLRNNFFGCQNDSIVSQQKNCSNNKKNCSNNKIRVDLFVEPILSPKHEILEKVGCCDRSTRGHTRDPEQHPNVHIFVY